jgi:hypothetical protein
MTEKSVVIGGGSLTHQLHSSVEGVMSAAAGGQYFDFGKSGGSP